MQFAHLLQQAEFHPEPGHGAVHLEDPEALRVVDRQVHRHPERQLHGVARDGNLEGGAEIVGFLQGYSITGCRRGFVGNFREVALCCKAAYCSTFKELRGKGKSRVGEYLRHTVCV